MHVWGNAYVSGSLPSTLTLTLPLALTASLQRCERQRGQEREREIVGGGSRASATGACASPSQNWTRTLWPTLVPPVLFLLSSSKQQMVSITIPVDCTPEIDKTCGRGRWA